MHFLNKKLILKNQRHISKYKDMQIQENINDNKYYIEKGTKKFIEVTISLFLAGFATFSILYCVQPILFLLSKSFSLSPAESSLSLSSSTAMMAIGMLFTGPLSDRIGRKKVMSISLLLATFFTFCCSQMNSWENVIFMRALTGLALSGVAAVAMTYLSEEIHPNTLSFSMGLYISGNTIGGFFGRFLSSFLAENFSWRLALEWISILAFIFSVFFIYLLPHSKNFRSVSLRPRKIFTHFILQWKNPVLSKLFMMGFLLMGSFITIFNYIGYRLLSKPFYVDHNTIGMLSMIYLIGVYSSPKAGMLIKKYTKGIMLILSLIMMIIGILISQWNEIILVVLGLIFFAAGFFAAHSVTSTWIGQHGNDNKGYTSSIYLFSYYLGSSILGTISGMFWIIGQWIGISVFVIIALCMGIILAMRLNSITYNIRKR
ncbi:MAG: MFS transporter [Buchnera aphidicola (Meitanaphis flavogallis)]